ncbi:hypothetical protein ACT2FY_01075 [Paraburkholderia fungorum]|uniref:hypothetical protein n=1 Tax=Paraburkholderia fungorum TaxID=134537 RepID=UPI00402BD69D
MKMKLSRLLPLLMMLFGIRSYGFGIDRLSAELDASQHFKSVTSFVVFNDDSNETIFVTARALKWDLGSKGDMTTTPSEDLEMYPSVQKIRPGESGVFKVRYSGAPLTGEGNYRVLFTQIRIPGGVGTNEDGITSVIGQDVAVGLAMTVPVYVSDFSVKSDVLDHVVAKFSQKSDRMTIDVANGGNRHIVVKSYRVNGTQKLALGPVLANHERSFSVESSSSEAIKSVELEIIYRDKSKTITATEVN